MPGVPEDARSLSTAARDALREVANIGAGHAATALSQITEQRIMISVPHVNVAHASSSSVPSLTNCCSSRWRRSRSA